ncbi:MarR family winged helix-turn-helix transcriptional regulator [Renibacterium salmoninarum]|uniref:MarR family winged helix-turn-helix transcriptional regulator n=1 Tax=Renibacterium salmoninarum TaxID=1646 RepID=UPI001F37CA53|nr:MarR family transcriptional regulator [Renibacterium salmoninarum]
MNLSSPATTALIDRLDRAGHVERRRSGTDRRQVQLASTEKAKQTGRALFGPLARHLSLAMQGLQCHRSKSHQPVHQRDDSSHPKRGGRRS